MIVKKVKAEGFRNIENAEVEFSEGINLLSGDNAEGKTNLLEAIYYISLGKSFRGANEKEMMGFGKQSAEISLDFRDKIREQNITVRFSDAKRRKFEQNGVKIFKLSDIVGTFRTVLFCPEHLAVIKEGPAARRGWLDVSLCQTRPVYLKSLTRFNKILKQRNKLLKDAEEDRKNFDATIEFWSDALAKESAVLDRFRVEYTKSADLLVREFFSDMTGGGEVASMRFISSSKLDDDACFDAQAVEAAYRNLLLSNLSREIAAGTSLYGAHKDDIDLRINEREARDYGSQGQQRSFALAMKLAEGGINERDFGEYPVFLLDDVLSELDAKRKEYLLKHIGGRQVIMTGCDLNEKAADRNIIVKGGTYTVIS